MDLTTFESVPAAEQSIAGLDRVETTKLYYFALDEAGHPVPLEFGNYRGLVNARTGDPITPVTPLYALVNHADVFATAIAALTASGHADGARVRVEDDGDIARLWVLFPSAGRELSVGFRLTSSYDRSISFSNHLIGRWHPDGGAVVLAGPKELGLHLALPHRAEAFDGLDRRIAGIIEAVTAPAAHDYLRALIVRAIETPIAFGSKAEKEALLRELLESQKHIRHVIGSVPDEGSRWDVYAAVMRYVTETPPSVLIRDRITARAEEWLRS